MSIQYTNEKVSDAAKRLYAEARTLWASAGKSGTSPKPVFRLEQDVDEDQGPFGTGQEGMRVIFSNLPPGFGDFIQKALSNLRLGGMALENPSNGEVEVYVGTWVSGILRTAPTDREPTLFEQLELDLDGSSDREASLFDDLEF